MNLLKIFALLLFCNAAFAGELPDEIFNIKLLTDIENLQGDIHKQKGIIRIEGIPHVYYSVKDSHYKPIPPLDNILVQVEKGKTLIKGVIGMVIMDEASCGTAITKMKIEIEALYQIKLDTHILKNKEYYSFEEGNKFIAIMCEGSDKTKLKLGLGLSKNK